MNIDNNNTLITDAIQKDIAGHSFNLNLSQIKQQNILWERKNLAGETMNFFFVKSEI
jgi:hypothetical protein